MTRNILAAMTAVALLAACGDNGTGPDPVPPTQTVARVEVTAPGTTLETGATLQMAATPRAGDGTALSRAVVWTSSDTLVARVSAVGLVTGVSAGTVTIRASSDGKKGEAFLTVAPQPVAWVQITPAGDITQPSGTSRQLGVIARAQGGAELPGRAATWTSSDTTVAAVGADGMLRARRVGTAVVIATVEGKTAQTVVFVTTLIHRIDVDRTGLVLGVGDQAEVRAVARAADGSLLERPFTWTSSNPAVVSVSAAGVVRGTGPGTAIVTVSSEGRSATVRVEVGGWTTQRMLAVGDSALPATAFVKTQGGRTFRYVATEGHLRLLGAGSRYELAVNGWLHVDGGVPVQAVYGSTGTYMYDAFTGDVMFYPAGTNPNGPPAFRGTAHGAFNLGITWRPDPNAPAATFVFTGL